MCSGWLRGLVTQILLASTQSSCGCTSVVVMPTWSKTKSARHQPILTTLPVRADSSAASVASSAAVASSGVPIVGLAAGERAVGEIVELVAQRAAAHAVEHRPVGRVGAVQLVAVDDAEIGEGVLDVDDALGADDRHALVDVEGRLLRHAPHRLQRRRGAAGEAVHGLADVGMLQAAHVDRLRIGARRRGRR